ncbi:MAG: hypothetical protein ACE5ES_01470 [Candidatus Nanoarchaeia archaeon]
MSEVIVSKYGGSSITSPADIERIGSITSEDSRRKVIVVSAPGKGNGYDGKITDMLIELAMGEESVLIDSIMERYAAIFPGQDLTSARKDLTRRLEHNSNQNGKKDLVAAWGEETNARLTAERLGYGFVDAREILRVSNMFGNAQVLPESEKKIRGRLRELSKPVVIPGFYGQTKIGQIATFSRGGSDLTGAVIAAALGAVEYENFTDTPIYAANPDIVKPVNPAIIRELTHEELRDLSYSGFHIFHPRAVKPVKDKGIPVHVRSTRMFPDEGTYVLTERIYDQEKPIVGVAYKNGFCSFSIQRDELNEERGILEKILDVFFESGFGIEHVTGAVDDVSIILKQEQLKEGYKTSQVVQELKTVVGEGTQVNIQQDLGSIVVAGKGLKGTRGIAAKVYGVLAENRVNVVYTSQGSQERCMIIGVRDADGPIGVRALLNHFDYLKVA